MYYPQEERYYPGENKGSSIEQLEVPQHPMLDMLERSPISQIPQFSWINKWENNIFSKSRMIQQTSFKKKWTLQPGCKNISK